MPTLTQLKYIIAVATYGSFVVAAEKCFVTQPTLSMQIRKLEEHLGVTIFDRGKHPIEPTPIGKKIIEQARIVIQEEEKIHEIVKEFKGEVAGTLTIGIIPTVAPYLLHRFVGKFSQKYPHANLQIYEMITDQVIENLMNYKIDVGIVSTPIKEPEIIEIPMYYEKIALYINKKHPLAKKQKIYTYDLQNFTDVWLLTQGHCFRYHVINLCELDNDSTNPLANISYESGSLESLFRLVEQEKGLTLFPELAEDNLKGSKSAIIREFADITPLREIGLIHRQNYTKKRLLQALEEEIKNSLPQYMLDKSRGTVVEWK